MTTDTATTTGERQRVCRLTNAAAVRRKALEIAGATRAQGFSRVGQSFLDRIEAATRAAVAREVAQHPSKGKTLL
jgi:hypothetical protein